VEDRSEIPSSLEQNATGASVKEMSTISFDTHTFVKRLTQAGMPEAQAEVLADSQAKLIDEKLATKHDLKELEIRLAHEMKELEARLVLQLTIRMGSMLVVGIGVVATLIKIL